nr:hypothetical protein [Tanacetum cinerariifolium]
MTEIKTKATMEEFVTKNRANYYSGITSIMVNGKIAYELKGRFLDDLRKNSFSATNGENAVEHIKYFLKIVDHIDLPNVNHERLRLAIFPISLFRNESKRFNEFKGSITTWVDLTMKFFGKYYQPSRSCKVMGTDVDMEYDPSDVGFGEWTETNIFNFETPLCKAFDAFNYLLKVNTELFTHDIERTKTYEDYMNECNNELDEPCGELPGMVQVGYMTYFQDYEWYDNLTDSSLKEEDQKQKTIYEKSRGDAIQSVINFCAWLKNLSETSTNSIMNCWWKINDHKCSLFNNWRDHIHGPYGNINTTYDPYLDSRNGRTCNDSNVQEAEEQH